jgi:hypothetical protein
MDIFLCDRAMAGEYYSLDDDREERPPDNSLKNKVSY